MLSVHCTRLLHNTCRLLFDNYNSKHVRISCTIGFRDKLRLIQPFKGQRTMKSEKLTNSFTRPDVQLSPQGVLTWDSKPGVVCITGNCFPRVMTSCLGRLISSRFCSLTLHGSSMFFGLPGQTTAAACRCLKLCDQRVNFPLKLCCYVDVTP